MRGCVESTHNPYTAPAATASVLTPLGLLLYFPAFSKRARAWYGK